MQSSVMQFTLVSVLSKIILKPIKFCNVHSLPSRGPLQTASELTTSGVLKRHIRVFSFNVITASGQAIIKTEFPPNYYQSVLLQTTS